MRLLTLVILIAFLSYGVAHAGAWPREKGTSFLSFGSTLSGPIGAPFSNPKSDYSFYFERGFAKDITLGLDASFENWDSYSAIAFVRMPMMVAAEKNVFAYQFGLGSINMGAGDTALVQMGASWGRGITTGWGNGWLALDVQSLVFVETLDVAPKIDLTLGLKTGDRLKAMMQLQAGKYPGSDPYLRAVPSIAWKLAEQRFMTVGAQFGVVGDDTVGISVGSWMEF